MLRQIYADYQGKAFVLIAISNEDVSAINSWISANNVEYAVAKDNNWATFTAYGISAIPHTFLIDKNGDIAWDNLGTGTYSEYKTQIDALLQ